MAANRMIYVIDDGADYRLLLQHIFTRFLPDQRVRFFDNGEALYQHILTEDGELAAGALPGLILMDFNMPVLNGLQTLTLLKQHPAWKRIPVVIMSSAVSDQEIEQCYDAGANSFVQKPMGFTLIKCVLTEICQYWLGLNKPGCF